MTGSLFLQCSFSRGRRMYPWVAIVKDTNGWNGRFSIFQMLICCLSNLTARFCLIVTLRTVFNWWPLIGALNVNDAQMCARVGGNFFLSPFLVLLPGRRLIAIIKLCKNYFKIAMKKIFTFKNIIAARKIAQTYVYARSALNFYLLGLVPSQNAVSFSIVFKSGTFFCKCTFLPIRGLANHCPDTEIIFNQLICTFSLSHSLYFCISSHQR